MAKIPVGETIAKSYSFAFKHAPTNFAVAWITLLLPTIGGLLVEHFYPIQFPAPGDNPAAALGMAFAGPHMLLFFIAFLCIFAQLALFTREALGLRSGSAWRQNPFGADTWRVILAMLLLIVVFIAIYVVVLVIAIFGAVAVATVAKLDASTVVRVITLIGAIALIVVVPVAWTYILLRLSFLVVPIVVAEKHVSLTRAWEMARGNVGRIFLVWLSVALPFLVLELLFVWFLAGGHLIPPIHAGMKPEEIAAWQQQYMATMQSEMRNAWTYWYLTVPLGVAFSTIVYGLFAAPAAFAYRALTATSSEEPR